MMRISSAFRRWPCAVIERSTTVWPSFDSLCLTVPVTCAVNDGVPPEVAVLRALVVLVLDTSRELGVPARLAHPLASGPLGNHTIRASGTATHARIAVSRTPMRLGQPPVSRTNTAAMTNAEQIALIASSQPNFTSLPVPNVCGSATGQHAYAVQCVRRHRRKPNPSPQQACDHQRQQQVERDRAESEPQRAVGRGERNKDIDHGDRREAVEQRRDHMHRRERDREQGDVAVHGIDHEARNAFGSQAARVRDPQRDAQGEQDQRDRAGSARQVPVGAGTYGGGLDHLRIERQAVSGATRDDSAAGRGRG